MKKRLLGLLITVMALSGMQGSDAPKPPPQVGQPAPDFTLPSAEGGSVSLKDYKGRWVVLYFYPKDFTTGCTLEAHNFERDLAWIAASSGVAVDATFSLASPFPAAKDRSFPLVHSSIPMR